MPEQIHFPKLLFFGASWCGPSNALWPVAKDAVRNAKAHVDIEYIDVDEQTDETKRYRIEGTPTTVMLTRKGGECERLAGYNYRELLDAMIRRSLV